VLNWIFVLFICISNELYAETVSTGPVPLTGLNYEISVDTRTNIDKLSDKDVSVRLNAVLSLSAEEDEKNVVYFLKMLQDKNSIIRDASIKGLIRCGKPSIVGPEFIKNLDIEKDHRIKIAYVQAMGQIKYTKGIPELEYLLKDNSPVLRTFALKALAEIGSPLAFNSITYMLNDMAEGVKITAAESVAELKIKSAQQNLIKNLSHPIFNVQKSMIEALGEVGDIRAKIELEKLLKNEKLADTVKIALDKIEKRESARIKKK